MATAEELPNDADWFDAWDDNDYDNDYEDDDPYGCCCPEQCLNPHCHHRLSECYTIEDIAEPSRLRKFWWWVKCRLGALLERLRSREPEDDEDDLPF